jgi:hypothetical protein
MSCSQETRHAVESGTEIVSLAHLGVPRVQRHPHADLWKLLLKVMLCRDGRPGCVLGAEEDGTDGISPSLEGKSAVALDRSTQERIVASKRLAHRLRLLFPQAD